MLMNTFLDSYVYLGRWVGGFGPWRDGGLMGWWVSCRAGFVAIELCHNP